MLNENSNKTRKIVLPYCYKDENTESEVKLAGKGCNFPYLTYTYLQYISYSSNSNYRKIYIHHKMEYQAEGLYVLTIASMCRRVKISNKTASKNIELLKEHNFLSKEMFEDELSKRKEAKEKNASASAYANAYTDSVDDSYHDSSEQHSDKLQSTYITNNLDKQNTESNKDSQQSQKRYADDSQYMKAAVYLFEKIKERLPNKKEPDFQKWADEVRKTVELDGVPVERYKEVLDWSQNDDFWQANILSTNKLRKQFDTIYLQMQRDNKQNAPKANDSWDYRKELYGE